MTKQVNQFWPLSYIIRCCTRTGCHKKLTKQVKPDTRKLVFLACFKWVESTLLSWYFHFISTSQVGSQSDAWTALNRHSNTNSTFHISMAVGGDVDFFICTCPRWVPVSLELMTHIHPKAAKWLIFQKEISANQANTGASSSLLDIKQNKKSKKQLQQCEQFM